jgi:hypothetical protein
LLIQTLLLHQFAAAAMSGRCPPVPSSFSSKDEELWMTGWMDGKDDPQRTKPSLLCK